MNDSELIVTPNNGIMEIPSVLDHDKLKAQYDKACEELDTQIKHSNFITRYIAQRIVASPNKDKIETWIDKITAFLWRRL